MIIKQDQMKNVGPHPLLGKLKGIKARSINPSEFITPDEFSVQSLFNEISWVEMPPGTVIPDHAHEGCEEAKIVVYGLGIYKEDQAEEEVASGDVILTEKGVNHRLENVGHYPLVYIALTVECGGN